MDQVGYGWVYRRLSSESLLAEDSDDAAEMLEEGVDGSREEIVRRNFELLKIKEEAESVSTAEFVAETTYLLREAGIQAGQRDSEVWKDEVNQYISDYVQGERLLEEGYPPGQELRDETLDLMTRLKNSGALEEELQTEVDDYLETYFN